MGRGVDSFWQTSSHLTGLICLKDDSKAGWNSPTKMTVSQITVHATADIAGTGERRVGKIRVGRGVDSFWQTSSHLTGLICLKYDSKS